MREGIEREVPHGTPVLDGDGFPCAHPVTSQTAEQLPVREGPQIQRHQGADDKRGEKCGHERSCVAWRPCGHCDPCHGGREYASPPLPCARNDGDYCATVLVVCRLGHRRTPSRHRRLGERATRRREAQKGVYLLGKRRVPTDNPATPTCNERSGARPPNHIKVPQPRLAGSSERGRGGRPSEGSRASTAMVDSPSRRVA
jgi:hypothetical protein